jgi:hypothetical protein
MNYIRFIMCLLSFGLSLDYARADGGIMRAHEVQGPFVVTIFTASEPQQDSPVDVSVMVQDRESNDAILDATVKLTFTPPAGSSAGGIEQTCGTPEMAGSDPRSDRFTVEVTRGQASNKLLYAAMVKFNAAGVWQLQAFVKHDDDFETITCSIPVSPPSRELAGLIPYLALPPLLVGLFALNQWLRGQL